jgi:hypothetical protein
LFLATVLIALLPWNLALWWMSRRLRYAIELDCDARVLQHRPDPQAYGSLLLDVSERTIGGAMPIAAMAEPISLIERRIAAMTARVPRFALLRGAAAALIASTLTAVACAAPRPASTPAPSTGDGRMVSDSVRRAADPAASAIISGATVSSRYTLRDSTNASHSIGRNVTSGSIFGVGTEASTEPRITTQFDRTPIRDIARQFATFSRRPILVREDVSATVSASVSNMPWDVALKAILALGGLKLSQNTNGDLLIVGAMDSTAAPAPDVIRGGAGYGASAQAGGYGSGGYDSGGAGAVSSGGGYGAVGASPVAGAIMRGRQGGGGADLRSPSGVPDTAYPRVVLGQGTIAASLIRDSSEWSARRGSVAVSGGGGGRARGMSQGGTGLQGVAVGGGGGGGGSANSLRYDRSPDFLRQRLEQARRTALEQFPDAFAAHPDELYYVTLVYDSTGTLIAKGARARGVRQPEEMIHDRDVLRATIPSLTVDAFHEWGMSDVSSSVQGPYAGVVLLYAFTGRAPW